MIKHTSDGRKLMVRLLGSDRRDVMNPHTSDRRNLMVRQLMTSAFVLAAAIGLLLAAGPTQATVVYTFQDGLDAYTGTADAGIHQGAGDI